MASTTEKDTTTLPELYKPTEFYRDLQSFLQGEYGEGGVTRQEARQGRRKYRNDEWRIKAWNAHNDREKSKYYESLKAH